MDLEDLDAAVELYDQHVRSASSDQWLDIVDAAALLWRLSLFGVDVCNRAGQLADDIEEVLDGPVYVFNDWHAAMTFGLAGRHNRADDLLRATREMAVGTNRMASDRAGLALISGFGAFAAGNPEGALDALLDIRSMAHVVGGSHAQRDVIDLTLLAAATRARRRDLVAALLAERAARRPTAALYPLLRANGIEINARWAPLGP